MGNYSYDLSVFDKRAVADLTKDIETMVNKFRPNVRDILTKVCEKGVSVAQPIFGKAVKVTFKVNKNTATISADGEAVCFIEFGTGEYTGTSQFANPLPISITPGSWSFYHAQTYQKWYMTHNGDMSEYPFNRYPKNAMLQAYHAMVQEFRDLARNGVLTL